MIELRLFQCERCGSKYNDKQVDIDCEKSHRQVEEIARTIYQAKTEYPNYIDIVFDDGEVRRYKE